MKPKHLYLEMYRVNYYFFLGWDKLAFEIYVKKYFNHEVGSGHYDGKCMMFTSASGSVVCLWAKKNDRGSFIHELVHAGSMTLDHIGIDARQDNGEALAYLVGHLYDKAYEKK
jgi:hypothetical protein